MGSGVPNVMGYGGSRSGKTFNFCRGIITRCIKAPGSRHAIFRHRANHVERSVGMDTLPKVFKLCFPKVTYELNKSEWVFRLSNGSEIWLCGLDDKDRTEKVLGQEFATIYFNECSQIAYDAILMAQTRLAQKVWDTVKGAWLSLKAYYDCNPPGTGHWSYKLFIEKKDPKSRQALANPEDYASLVMNPVHNIDNLDQSYLRRLQNLPAKQRQRFLEGKFVADLDNALWTLELIEKCRHPLDKALPDFETVVIAVDPSGASGEEDERSDEIGIAAAAKGLDGHYYVLEDASLRAGPAQWAKRAILAYSEHMADRIVAEKNYGGAMVKFTIETADKTVNVKEITASRGKVVRAEPISALYEKGLVHHLQVSKDGRKLDFGDLEDQMVNFTSAGYMGDRSPDRADALVWALSELSQGPEMEFHGLVG
jgi:hypothetical protein